ncbi:hypothetical protein EDC04DRAFT_2716797 [Pisolithus marmoratus]|nr:hypothetical protein EDC04DRAFT_2716797 [Pisolithus marmoratus]
MEYPHLCSIVAYLPLVYAAILGLELFRARKSKKYLYLEQKSNRRQVAHTHNVYELVFIISTDLVLGPVVGIRRPFHDADL